MTKHWCIYGSLLPKLCSGFETLGGVGGGRFTLEFLRLGI